MYGLLILRVGEKLAFLYFEKFKKEWLGPSPTPVLLEKKEEKISQKVCRTVQIWCSVG